MADLAERDSGELGLSIIILGGVRDEGLYYNILLRC